MERDFLNLNYLFIGFFGGRGRVHHITDAAAEMCQPSYM